MSEATPDARAIFLAALEKGTPEARQAYLEGACARAPAMLARVKELLAAHEGSLGPLDSPPPGVAPDRTLDQPIPEQPGTVIGPYKLLQQIGEGGMGVVYMAEQSEPVARRVALKIIKPGMDTRQVVARFAAEKQALAMMDHPNIAKVFDAGSTDSGRPYFVMELVKGIPITNYCDEQHLTPRERLELFVPICQAVQHAHQKGIIHRDIKPSNILVALYDRNPVPKVIDFGVAKATGQKLTEKTLFTHYGQIVGTMEYMSPEQANLNQLDIDTRSDIYSLGVVLYELLTGATPFSRERLRSAAFEEMMRIIREEEPPKPSTRLSTIGTLPTVAANRKSEPGKLSTLVRGELDWIVMKSLDKDRRRRYETAKDFAADVVKHLEHEPVDAGPPSAAYRLAKFTRRHRASIAVTSLVAVTLVLGLIGTSMGMAYAMRAWGVAEIREREAVAAQNAEKEQRRIAEESERAATAARDAETTERKKSQESEREALWHLYVARQFPLADAWESGSFGLLNRLLGDLVPQESKPDFRGWEYSYYRDQCAQASEPVGVNVRRMCMHPESGSLAMATVEGNITILEVGNKMRQRSFDVCRDATLRGVAWSPDGSRIACGYSSGEIAIYDSSSGTMCSQSKELPSGVRRIAWSGDGAFLAAACNKPITPYFWIFRVADDGEIALSRKLRHPKCDWVWSFDWSPDGKRFASGHRWGQMCVWEVPSWQCLARYASWSAPVASVRWNPAGDQVAAIHENWVHVRSADGEAITKIQVSESSVYGLSWVGDDCIATGGADQQVKVWNTREGRLMYTLPIHNSGVGNICWEPRSGTLFSQAGSTVHASIPGRSVDPAMTLRHGSEEDVLSIAWSPTDDCVMTCTSKHKVNTGAVRFWRVTTGELIKEERSHCSHVLWCRKHIVSACRHAHAVFWDEEFNRLGEQCSQTFQTLCSIRFSPSGRFMAAFPGMGALIIVDLITGETVARVRVVDYSTGVWSPDESRLYVATRTGTSSNLRVVNISDGSVKEMPGPKLGAPCFAIDPTGRLLAAGGKSGHIRFLDTNNRTIHVAKGHTGPVTNIEWAPDGLRIASASNDGTARIWDAATATELLRFSSENGTPFLCVKWSNDGRRLAAASGNNVYVYGSPNIEYANGRTQLLDSGALSVSLIDSNSD